MMCRTVGWCRLTLLWGPLWGPLWGALWGQAAGGRTGVTQTEEDADRLSCQPGYYCPEGSRDPLPCPRGTFGPRAGARTVDDCISCPPHHFASRPGLAACLPCGSRALQLLPGQDRCVCHGEGHHFQPSDGRCPCALGYESAGDEGLCVRVAYEICRDGRIREQHGACWDTEQWTQHCAQLVCQSSEDYKGYDRSLGLCVCRTPTEGQEACEGWCRGRPVQRLRLVCAGVLRLLYSDSGHQLSVSGHVLDNLLKPWDFLEALKCNSQVNFSYPVYALQTGEDGFLGLLSAVPEAVRSWLWENRRELRADSVGEDESHWLKGATARGGGGNASRPGLLNPTTCLHLQDILLFTVSQEHYPQYDRENLYNTNHNFDWGPFRDLAQNMALTQAPWALFPVAFSEPGVYVLRLSSNPNKRMYVKVMPWGGQCYEAGPFFPTVPYHVTRLGIARRRRLLLRPDWLVIGGLMVGAVVMLGVCVALLVLFREYGWPEKQPVRVRYRASQLRYQLDDYSSKGSRAMAVKKNHRSLQARLSGGSAQTDQIALSTAVALMKDEFWDYEQQVDLEAFNASMFFDILLKHSASVSARLAQLRVEVKDLYQGVMAKFKGLRVGSWSGKTRQEFEELCTEVEREQARRKALAETFRKLLETQLQTLRAEARSQQKAYVAFAALLRQVVRLVEQSSGDTVAPDSNLGERNAQNVLDRVAVMTTQMAELVSTECQRQGTWGMLGEGTGARLLCPVRGVVLSREDIIGPEGTILACDAVHVDSCTGLILPNPGAQMRVASGHSLPVPPDFFLHPQTGRLLPTAGNVGFDPASSTLVFSADACAGEVGKWESPLLPFVPYPRSSQTDLPVTSRLRGLRPGQRMALGGPMCDPDTGILVPILAVTIHPQTGLVYPLGGVHTCPFTSLPQPIQLGAPMLEPSTGSLVLITGVSLDALSGEVVPVGGLLLGESFTEPLSGRAVRIGGASVRGRKLVPHAGGFQALLDAQSLGARARAVELLRRCEPDWEPKLCQPGRPPWGELCPLRTASVEVDQTWRSSRRCQLQLICRLEILLDWAWEATGDGGSQGEIQFPGTEFCLPALPGFEYPDPGGSGLRVPVLGAQLDWVSRQPVPLAGTMEDADGKGLVPIRVGARVVDPVTGMQGSVVGARLDVSRRTVVPVTVSDRITGSENTDREQVDVLQKESCLRSRNWKQQRLKEEELLRDLDMDVAAARSATEKVQADWGDREGLLKTAAAELHHAAEAEAQRRAGVLPDLYLLLPPHVLLVLTGGDEMEREQQHWWQTELETGLDRVSMSMDRLQLEQDRWTALATIEVEGYHVRLRELNKQLDSRRAELEAAFTLHDSHREHCQLRLDTALAVLSGSFWYRDYGLTHVRVYREPQNPVGLIQNPVGLIQHRVLPLLQRLVHLLEANKPAGRSPGSPNQLSPGMLSQSQRDMVTAPDPKSPRASAPQGDLTRPPGAPLTAMPSLVHGIDDQTESETTLPTYICVPTITEEDWNRLLGISPLFRLLRQVEQQLRSKVKAGGPEEGEAYGRGRSFMDLLDAQWQCEGELITLEEDALSPRELLVYQHGVFLLQMLHTRAQQTPAVNLQVASSLPSNDYHQNAFRNSFFYQEAEEKLFVRRQRLESVGGFSLLLLHTVSHVAVGDMNLDSSPAFQRVFFQVLQVCLGEMFQSRLPTKIKD